MKHILFFWGAVAALTIGLASCQKAPELTLTGPASLEIGADGGSNSITFTANRDWSVRSSDSWVSVSPSSGTASDGAVTVNIRCSENTTYEDRSATITITMEELTQTVTVKQPANLGIVIPTQSFNLASDARSIEVEVRANVQYSVSVSDNWIKQTGTKGLTSNKLIFSVEENETYDARSATITIKPQNATVQEQVISVKQAQKDALIVKDTSFDMPYGGGEIEVKVEANVSFDVKPSEDWIHYVETKALSGSTVRLKVDENATFSAREGKIEIKQKNGTLSHTLTVKQAGRIAVTSIELNKTSLTLKEGASETLTATVKPDNATDKTVTWSSSAPNIATVDEAGNVTAVAKGEATITAQAGEKTAKCTVTVYKDIPVTSIELDKNTLSLVVGDEATLKATVKPEDTTFKTVTWTSSNTSIATVDENGKVVAVAQGTSTVTASCGDKKASCEIVVINKKTMANPVDLGIIITRDNGSKYIIYWADCNVGASCPEEYGDYYKWGATPERLSVPTEIEEKYRTEKKTILDLEDDAAYVYYGSDWRMPTSQEFDALWANTTVKWTSKNGINGLEVQSKVNNNSIFLPAAGRVYGERAYEGEQGFYWSSSLNQSYNLYARYGSISSSGGSVNGMGKRSFQQSIRAVRTEDIQSQQAVDLGLSVKWASCNLGANAPEQIGYYFAWGETEPKTTYSWGTYKWCNGSQNTLTKYCHSDKNGLIVDKKTVLEKEDDAAYVSLGGKWRMPTVDECKELIKNTTIVRTTVNGTPGYRFTSKIAGYEKTSIFIPLTDGKPTGYSFWNDFFCWSSSRAVGTDYNACEIHMEGEYIQYGSNYRYIGLPIRPVSE